MNADAAVMIALIDGEVFIKIADLVAMIRNAREDASLGTQALADALENMDLSSKFITEI